MSVYMNCWSLKEKLINGEQLTDEDRQELIYFIEDYMNCLEQLGYHD